MSKILENYSSDRKIKDCKLREECPYGITTGCYKSPQGRATILVKYKCGFTEEALCHDYEKIQL